MTTLDKPYVSDGHLFIHRAKVSLKAALFHNGIVMSSVSVGYASSTMKESWSSLTFLTEIINTKITKGKFASKWLRCYLVCKQDIHSNVVFRGSEKGEQNVITEILVVLEEIILLLLHIKLGLIAEDLLF